mgnify:FL=1
MKQNLLRRGQRVVLEARKEGQVWRHTFVIDLALPQQLVLTPLTEGEIISVYEVGSKVTGYIPTPIRAYQFESTVIQVRSGVSPYLIISLPESVTPIQRRRFFRVKVLHSVNLLPIPNDEEEQLSQPIEVYGTDINAGGVGVRIDLSKMPSRLNLREHQRLQLRLFLPPIEKAFPEGLVVEAVGEILWMRKNGQTLKLGIAFTKIDRRVQERIIAWCFAYQCQLLRLGLWSDEV